MRVSGGGTAGRKLDYRDMNEAAAGRRNKRIQCRRTGPGALIIRLPPLMRLALTRLSEDRYRMLWTSHHILFDGWSIPVLMEEFLSIYESLVTGKEVVPDAGRPL